MKSPLYVALIHHPVVDKHGALIVASVTNMDLHDIARSSRTFGVKRYFVVHPSPDEQALNRRIIKHWESGFGKSMHPTRTEAFEFVTLANEFSEVENTIFKNEGVRPLKVGTSARRQGDRMIEAEALDSIVEGRPVLLIFGTGYGLSAEWQNNLDLFLSPIEGVGAYNHLSVRSAVAIYLDRLNRKG